MASSRKSSTHKAVQLLHGFNDDPLKACSLVEKVTPVPGKDEVLIHMLCRPVHQGDVLSVQGRYPHFVPKKFPITIGIEGVGKISEVGEDVTNVKVGQRVYPLLSKTAETDQGSWQEYVVVPALRVIPIPDSVSDESASQFFGNPWTVYSMIQILQVPKGEYVIQSAAASVLGRMFIQLAKHKGIKDSQIEELKAIGADEVINYIKEDVVDRVKQLTGGKLAYAGIDCLVASSVRTSGEVLLFGILQSSVLKMECMDFILWNV
ncbi:hypothetical protein CY35_04G017700 [Sphagnum magellanicum]|nr:hypothetical protein CY35_04G017700 [Sphagnum magellanicum]